MVFSKCDPDPNVTTDPHTDEHTDINYRNAFTV